MGINVPEFLQSQIGKIKYRIEGNSIYGLYIAKYELLAAPDGIKGHCLAKRLSTDGYPINVDIFPVRWKRLYWQDDAYGFFDSPEEALDFYEKTTANKLKEFKKELQNEQ